jgi:hypothetical protein
MLYRITNYTYNQAKKLNVIVKPSYRKDKKIDVFSKDGYLIASVGAKGYFDYPTYVHVFGKEYADKRRKLYKIRHRKDRLVKGSAGYYADKLLW